MKRLIIVFAAAATAACGASSGAQKPTTIGEQSAKQMLQTEMANLIQASGLNPSAPAKAVLTSCNDLHAAPSAPEYSVGVSARATVNSAEDATRMATAIRNYMQGSGFTKVRLVTTDLDIAVYGAKGQASWGIDYLPKGSSHEFSIGGSTDCNVTPDGSDTPQTSSNASSSG